MANPKISMAFQEVVKAREFNQFLSDIVPVGVYSNQTSCLEFVGSNLYIKSGTIIYSPTSELIDEDSTSIRVEYTEDTDTGLSSSPFSPYIMMTVVWSETVDGSIPVFSVSTKSEMEASVAAKTHICLGRMLYDNGATGKFDYSVQTRPVLPGTPAEQFIISRGVGTNTSGENTQTLYVGPGKVVINNKLVSFTGGEITIPLTGTARTDLLVINEEGVLIRKPGTTSVAEPISTSEKSAVAIAQVNVPASTTAMIHPQNDVTRLTPYSVKERYQNLTGYLGDLDTTTGTGYGGVNSSLVAALNRLVSTSPTGIIQTWINNNSTETPTSSKIVKRNSSGCVLSRGLSIYNTDGGGLVSTWNNVGQGWMTGDFTVGTSSILARFGVKSSSDSYTGGIVFQRASNYVSYGLRFDTNSNLYLGVSSNGVVWTPGTADILNVNSSDRSINILSTATSTTTGTGALTVAGGVGVGGTLNVAHNSIFNENLSVVGVATIFGGIRNEFGGTTLKFKYIQSTINGQNYQFIPHELLTSNIVYVSVMFRGADLNWYPIGSMFDNSNWRVSVAGLYIYIAWNTVGVEQMGQPVRVLIWYLA